VQAGADTGWGEIPAPLLCVQDCKASPCGACSRVKRAKWRARAYGYEGDNFTGPEWRALVEACGGRCLRCGVAEDLTVDHVIPLSLGGPNPIDNVQVLCAACNSAKGDEIMDYRTA
jgi:5-methylcytosine-specific restriction endonuclease McrA